MPNFIARDLGDGKATGYFAESWTEAAAKFMRKHEFDKVILEGRWGDMGFLAEFAGHIKEIVVTNLDARADGIGSLSALRALNVNLKTKKPVELSRLQLLERCSLHWHPAYAQELFALPRLDSVLIIGYSGTDFTGITESSSVRRLRLSSPKLFNFDGIGALKALRHLTVQQARQLTSLDGVDELASLESICLEGAKLVTSTAALQGMRALNHLALINVGACAVEHVVHLNELQFLAMTGIPITPQWHSLMRMKSLSTLTVLVEEKHIPSEDSVREMAERAGRTLIALHIDGMKKRPLVTVKLGVVV